MSMRQQCIRLIHTGKRALAMDDESYRETLVQLTGKNSCADMTDDQLYRVVQRLRSLGFDPAGRPETAAQRALIRQIWLLMFRFGVVRDDSQRALNAYCWRMTHLPLPRCNADQCQHIIECLKLWFGRAATPAQQANLNALLSKQAEN